MMQKASSRRAEASQRFQTVYLSGYLSNKPALIAGRWQAPRSLLLDVTSNISPVSHLVIQTDEGDVHLYQPFKQGHLKVEVLSQIIHISTGAQLGRETSLRILWGTQGLPSSMCFKHLFQGDY